MHGQLTELSARQRVSATHSDGATQVPTAAAVPACVNREPQQCHCARPDGPTCTRPESHACVCTQAGDVVVLASKTGGGVAASVGDFFRTYFDVPLTAPSLSPTAHPLGRPRASSHTRHASASRCRLSRRCTEQRKLCTHCGLPRCLWQHQEEQIAGARRAQTRGLPAGATGSTVDAQEGCRPLLSAAIPRCRAGELRA